MATFSEEEKAYYMEQALLEAQKSLAKNEIPIGCVIVKDGEIIGRGHNAREENSRLSSMQKSWQSIKPTALRAIGACWIRRFL